MLRCMKFDLFTGLRLQVLQQCLLCKSRRNKHSWDELSWSGLLIWFGFPFKCKPTNLSHLLFLPPERDVAWIPFRFTIIIVIIVTEDPFLLQRRWILPTTTATRCLTSHQTLLYNQSVFDVYFTLLCCCYYYFHYYDYFILGFVHQIIWCVQKGVSLSYICFSGDKFTLVNWINEMLIG